MATFLMLYGATAPILAETQLDDRRRGKTVLACWLAIFASIVNFLGQGMVNAKGSDATMGWVLACVTLAFNLYIYWYYKGVCRRFTDRKA